MEGRCMKCKENREMKDMKVEPTPRGTFMARGKCTVCGTGMCKILSKDQAAKLGKK